MTSISCSTLASKRRPAHPLARPGTRISRTVEESVGPAITAYGDCLPEARLKAPRPALRPALPPGAARAGPARPACRWRRCRARGSLYHASHIHLRRRHGRAAALPVSSLGKRRLRAAAAPARFGARRGFGAGTGRLRHAAHRRRPARQRGLRAGRAGAAGRGAGRPMGRSAHLRRHAVRRVRRAGLHRRPRPALADGPVAQARPRRDGPGLRAGLGRQRPHGARGAVPRRHVPRVAGLWLRCQARRRGIRRRRQRLRDAGAGQTRAAADRVPPARLPAGAMGGRRHSAHSPPRPDAELQRARSSARRRFARAMPACAPTGCVGSSTRRSRRGSPTGSTPARCRSPTCAAPTRSPPGHRSSTRTTSSSRAPRPRTRRSPARRCRSRWPMPTRSRATAATTG